MPNRLLPTRIVGDVFGASFVEISIFWAGTDLGSIELDARKGKLFYEFGGGVFAACRGKWRQKPKGRSNN